METNFGTIHPEQRKVIYHIVFEVEVPKTSSGRQLEDTSATDICRLTSDFDGVREIKTKKKASERRGSLHISHKIAKLEPTPKALTSDENVFLSHNYCKASSKLNTYLPYIEVFQNFC